MDDSLIFFMEVKCKRKTQFKHTEETEKRHRVIRLEITNILLIFCLQRLEFQKFFRDHQNIFQQFITMFVTKYQDFLKRSWNCRANMTLVAHIVVNVSDNMRMDTIVSTLLLHCKCFEGKSKIFFLSNNIESFFFTSFLLHGIFLNG